MDSSEVGPPARPAALLLPRLLSLFSRCVHKGVKIPRHFSRRPRCSPHPQLQKHAIGWCVTQFGNALVAG